MKKTIIQFVSVSLLALSMQSFAQGQKSISFTAKLDGSQETPATGSTALGVGRLTLSQNLDSLWIQVDFTGLQSAFTGAHIHTGPVGVSGGVAFALAAPTGNRIRDLITGASLTPTVIAKLFAVQYYFNIHTTTSPNGEIRGQIYPEADMNYSCFLNAAQEVPAPTNPNVYGIASFNLSKNSGVLTYSVVLNNLTGPVTGAHLHKGIVGQAGGVLSALNVNANGTITGTLTPTAFLSTLMNDSVYINVHTTANANGEARGQLMPTNGLFASAYLNGAQEVPSVNTKGRGEAGFWFTTKLDSVYCKIAADSLSGAVTGAHLHLGAIGVSGGVALNLSAGIQANNKTVILGAPVTATLINSMIMDGVYINLHTVANANGEIRGQLVPFARYTGIVCMNGAQETPPTASTAMGGGMVSIDRAMTNAHVMVVASGLAAVASGAHIHNGNMGVGGGVAFDLTSSYSNNGIFTYWTASSSPAFATANGTSDLAGGNYINIHDATYANGEIRGQIGYNCSQVPSGIKNYSVLSNVSLYPNPVSNNLTVDILAISSDKTNIKVYDLIGNLVINQEYSAVNKMNLNISVLNAGLYVIQVSNGGQVFQTKFIKN